MPKAKDTEKVSTPPNSSFYCERALHGDVRTPADYFVRASEDDGFGRLVPLTAEWHGPAVAWAACKDHLNEAFAGLASANPDVKVFIVRRVNDKS